MANVKRRSVSIRINGKQVENSFAGISKEARIIRRELSKMVIGSEEYNKKAKELRQVNAILDKHRQKIKGTKSSFDKMKAGLSGFIGIAAGAFAVDSLLSYTGELFMLGTEMEVLGKKAETVFGDALPQVSKAAEENANAMGLTISQYTDAATAIGDLLIPMKFTREEAASISTNLVDLSGALSEWTGGQKSAAEVSDILSKAILGEREQLKTLGISIQEADVKARLAEKGLQNLTGEMLQQAKAAATLELITEKSADAQASFAANSDTLVRKQAELRATFAEIRDAMATALIPVFHRLLEAATPVIKSFSDFVINLLNGQKATGKFSGLLNFLVTGLKNTGKFVVFLGQVFGKLFDFLLENGGGAIEFIIVKFAQLQNFGSGLLNQLAKLTNIETRFEKIDIQAVKASFQEYKKARLESGVDDPIAPKVENPKPGAGFTPLDQEFGPTTGGVDVKAIEKAEKAIDKLRGRVSALKSEVEIGLLSEDEQAIAKIEQRFDKELQKALELSKSNNAMIAAQALEQVKELERLKTEAIVAEQERQSEVQFEKDFELFEKKLEKDVENAEKLLAQESAFLERRQELKDEIQAFIDKDEEETRAEALEALEEHYTQLLDLAEQFGMDTTGIVKDYRIRQQQINQEFDKKELKDKKDAIIKKAELLRDGFGGFAKITASYQQLINASGREAAALNKTLSLITIAAKTASAIASGIAQAVSAGPFPANLAAITTTVGAVLANAATARKILNDAPDVPQRKKGGYFNVRGMDDGQPYSARYIGRPGTGMLPNKPVVLASEAGPEYFVSNRDLQNPVVLNYVRAIENIRTSRGVRQFQNGGFTEQPTGAIPTSSQSASGNVDQQRLSTVLERLADRLDKPIYALIEDLTIAEIQDRARELSALSGGAI